MWRSCTHSQKSTPPLLQSFISRLFTLRVSCRERYGRVECILDYFMTSFQVNGLYDVEWDECGQTGMEGLNPARGKDYTSASFCVMLSWLG